MQRTLDEALIPEALAELRAHLDASPSDSAEFQRLRQVDRMLRTAPHERAPQRLAEAIMARLAEAVSARQMPRVSGLALGLGLALAAAAMTPVLLATAWLLLTTLGSAEMLATVLQRATALMALGIALAEQIVAAAQTLLAANTDVALLLAAAVPASLLWLMRFALRLRAQRIN
ncbi:MAG: hypothetical protein ACUVSX_15930 [Aggregatilineales bacterium]